MSTPNSNQIPQVEQPPDELDMDVIVPEPIDIESYDKYLQPSNYAFTRTQPVDAVTITATDSVDAVFNLYNWCNVSNSRADLVLSYPAVGGDEFAFHADHPPIKQLILEGEESGVITDIKLLPAFFKMTVPATTDMYEYYGRGNPGHGVTGALTEAEARLRGTCRFQNPNQPTFTTTTTTTPAVAEITIPSGTAWANDQNSLTADAKITAAMTAGTVTAVSTSTTSFAGDPYLSNAGTSTASTCDPRYAPNHFLKTGAVNEINRVICSIDFGMLKESVFGLDWDWYSKEQLMIRMVFQPSNRMFWNITDDAEVATTATISDFYFYQAIQQNEDARALMKSMVERGVDLPIPFPIFKEEILGGTAETVQKQLKLNKASGPRLLRIYSAERMTSESKGVVANFHNAGAVKITDIQTSLNDKSMQSHAMTCAEYEHFKTMRHFTPYSFLFNDPRCINEMCGTLFIEDFTDSRDLTQVHKTNKMISGLDMTNTAINYAREITKEAVALTTVYISIMQRFLHFTPGKTYVDGKPTAQ